MVSRVNACAHSPFFRYPGIRLNQLNWNAELYAYAATMTGNPSLLRSDYRRQVVRFCDGAKRPWTKPYMQTADGGSPNLGPGYRFHYLPNQRASHPFNIDSAEYANITIHFLLFHAQAREGRHGAAEPQPPRAARGLGRAHADGLLDARGVPQLGLRAGPDALADRQDVRVRAAGAAGDREVAAVPLAGRVRAVGEVPARPGVRALPAVGARGRRRAVRAALPQRRARAARRRPGRQVPVRGADGRQRRPRDRPRARHRQGRRAAAVLRLRSRHRPARGLDAHLLGRRCSASTAAPSRTAARRSPGCTTPTAGRSQPSAARHRAASASSCARSTTA